MIFERDVYRATNFLKTTLVRLLDSYKLTEEKSITRRKFLPVVDSSSVNSDELINSCPYLAIEKRKDDFVLNLNKCTLCMACLSVKGVSMEEVELETSHEALISRKSLNV